MPPPLRRKPSGSKPLLLATEMKSKQPLPDGDSPLPVVDDPPAAQTAATVPLSRPLATVASALDWVAEEFYQHNDQFCEGTTAVYSCGQNEYGELGHGDTTQRASFARVQLFDDKDVISIGAGTVLPLR